MDLILTLSTIKAFPIDILVSGPVQLEKACGQADFTIKPLLFTH